MPYAFIQDVPANPTIYGQIREKLGAQPPRGLVAHVVIKRETGLRYIDVWQTQADWESFRDERVEPVVAEVMAKFGIAHDHALTTSEEVEVVDTWLGAIGPHQSAGKGDDTDTPPSTVITVPVVKLERSDAR